MPLVLGGALALLLAGCEDSNRSAPRVPAESTHSVPDHRAHVPPGRETIELIFPYGSEKQNWVEAVTEEFHRGRPETKSGKLVVVKGVPIGSGELVTEILEGRLEAHLASPASGAFIELGNADSMARAGKPLVGDTKNLVLSPVVIAMWKPMAEAIGWGKRPIGWRDIIDLARDPQGWAAHGLPQWGQFRFGHTHPEYSNSGLISVIAEVYAGAGKTRDLTLDDLSKPEVAEFLQQIERSVVHYGSSTGFFGKKMFERGPGYLSAAVLYENMVIESYDPKHQLPFPLVAIYPKEGTFWSDHPVGVVERPWVTDEHREAAQTYIDFLLAEEQQKRALEFGFRPVDVNLAQGAPIDAAHGVDPSEPKNTLAVPPAPVIKAIIDLWKQNKKHANVVLTFDVSGSMQGSKLAGAKEGARELVAMLGDEDLLSIAPFNNQVAWAMRRVKVGDNRQRLLSTITSLFANGGTALYDAVAESYQSFEQEPTPDMITAVVVLSDGDDTASQRYNLKSLLNTLSGGAEAEGVRVFTIGYGNDADEQVLKGIAEGTNARCFKSDEKSIRQVFKEISTFF
ncbi:MAG: extracellular solute-binding protein [Planctomycetota bacterium]